VPQPEDSINLLWREAAIETAASYRKMIDAALAQLSDEEFFARPTDHFNSTAHIIRHLGGNLKSRWTDFLATDGEKPDRDRDQEFADWPGDRSSLMRYFQEGWSALVMALEQIDSQNLTQSIRIRGEAHSVPQAIQRSLTHIAYHVGQILLISRLVHQGDWKWLTIAPGESQQHNEKTWGTSESRSVFGKPQDSL